MNSLQRLPDGTPRTSGTYWSCLLALALIVSGLVYVIWDGFTDPRPRSEFRPPTWGTGGPDTY